MWTCPKIFELPPPRSFVLLNPNFTTFGCFLKCWYPQIIHFNRVFHYKPSILGYPYFWKHHSKIHLGPMGAWDIPIGPTFETWTRLRGSLHKHTGGKPQKQWNVWNGFCREHIMCIYIYLHIWKTYWHPKKQLWSHHTSLDSGDSVLFFLTTKNSPPCT